MPYRERRRDNAGPHFVIPGSDGAPTLPCTPCTCLFASCFTDIFMFISFFIKYFIVILM